MKKIIRIKDLPTEQRIRLELILERNRVKKPKSVSATLPKQKPEQPATASRTAKTRIKQKEQLTKYTDKLPLTFGKNDFEQWLNNNLN